MAGKWDKKLIANGLEVWLSEDIIYLQTVASDSRVEENKYPTSGWRRSSDLLASSVFTQASLWFLFFRTKNKSAKLLSRQHLTTVVDVSWLRPHGQTSNRFVAAQIKLSWMMFWLLKPMRSSRRHEASGEEPAADCRRLGETSRLIRRGSEQLLWLRNTELWLDGGLCVRTPAAFK